MSSAAPAMPAASGLAPPAYNASADSSFGKKGQTSYLSASPAPPIYDTFLDPANNVSAKKVSGLFLSGLAAAFAGKWVLSALLKKPGAIAKEAEHIKFETNNILKNDPAKTDEMNIAQSFGEAISSIYRLALADPEQRKALLGYMGSSVFGYLSGSFVQATQETWVRREETKIRAHMINRLQDVFRQSIRIKNEFDNQLREETRQKIRRMLEQAGVAQADLLVLDQPVPESTKTRQHYFYEPTHRTVFGNQNLLPPVMTTNGTTAFSAQKTDNPSTGRLEGMANENVLKRLQTVVPFALGVFTGATLQGFVKLFTKPGQGAEYQGKKVVYETIQVKDKEAWWINGIKNRRNFSILMGFFALSAGARIGKLAIDGLREIEVTRVNARTELDYQTHNWLTQDPGFHRIAETEALQDSLRLLGRDLPSLRNNPVLVQQRIHAILTNVGRNSAPKYFPMTPPVGLVVARS